MTKEIEVVQRRYGSETEYSYSKNISPQRHIVHLPIKPEVPHYAGFLANGGRLYLDQGIIEYATPECETLEQLVVHELAGESLVAYSSDKIDLIRALFKRAASAGGILTYGSHENYSTLVQVAPRNDGRISYETSVLAAHFATRTIFTGSGLETGGNGYKLSQKMQGITAAVGVGNTSKKALVNTRQEHWNGGAEEKRLHVVCGDANMSPWAIKMKFGTTSLVLRLLENKIKLEVLLRDSLKAAHRVAGSVSGITESLLLRSGKSTTAIEMQRYFLRKCRELSKVCELPPDELAVLDEWEKVLNALSSYAKGGVVDPVLYQLDWFVRMQINDRVRENNPNLNGTEIINKDLRFDLMPDGVGNQLRGEGRLFSSHSPSSAAIESAIHNPPPGRASLRGRAIGVGMKQLVKVDWDRIETVRKVETMPLNGDYTEEVISTTIKRLFG